MLPVQAPLSDGVIPERREQKMGGKGTFSSIGAIAAAAGYVMPVSNSSPSSGTPPVPLKTGTGPLYLHPGPIHPGQINSSTTGIIIIVEIYLSKLSSKLLSYSSLFSLFLSDLKIDFNLN